MKTDEECRSGLIHACMSIDVCTRLWREAGDVTQFSRNVNAVGVDSKKCKRNCSRAC